MISTGALNIDVMSEEGISYYLEGAIEISTWLLHFIYVMTLVERLTPSIRGEFDLWFVIIDLFEGPQKLSSRSKIIFPS